MVVYLCMQNDKNNKKDLKFYPAVERKNHYEITVDYIQWGPKKHTHKYSVCKGKKILGVQAWSEKNPKYVTREVWEQKVCKSKSDLLEYITRTEYIYEKTGA